MHLPVSGLRRINIVHFWFVWFYFVTFFFAFVEWNKSDFPIKLTGSRLLCRNMWFALWFFFTFPTVCKGSYLYGAICSELHEKPVGSRVAIHMITKWLNQTLTAIKTCWNAELMMSLFYGAASKMKSTSSILHVLVCIEGFMLSLLYMWGYKWVFQTDTVWVFR